MSVPSLATLRLSIILSFLISLLCSTVSLAQPWYVKPTAEIPLRRGMGSDYKILAIVSDGVPVTILEETETWANVTTNDGKEGWILKRYLTQDTPLEEVVNRLRASNNKLKEDLDETKAQNEELQNVKIALEKALENNKAQLEETTGKYNTLVNDTSNVIAIKNDLTQTRQDLTMLQQKIGEVAAENNRLKASRNIRWFLAGGGTLILGCIIGLVSARSKKRKSSLY